MHQQADGADHRAQEDGMPGRQAVLDACAASQGRARRGQASEDNKGKGGRNRRQGTAPSRKTWRAAKRLMLSRCSHSEAAVSEREKS